ncbi:hypothetical protein BDV32DRAFT_155154 [Aspergillus pseudonomiae]|nr:hypothetical protein BDV32DRAFT_155154 [Aspergillus pseudonomiae]
MARTVDLCLPILSGDDDQEEKDVDQFSMKDELESLQQADFDAVRELLRVLRVLKKRGIAQRVAIAAYVSGCARDTSWMIQGHDEGFKVEIPTDKWYGVCEMMVKEGFLKAKNLATQLEGDRTNATLCPESA